MADIIEVRLEDLTGSELEYWAGNECFEIYDARFLMNDFKPTALYRRQILPRRIIDTESRLKEWLGGNGYKSLLGRPSSGAFIPDVPHDPGEPSKPIPKDVLKAAAESMRLKPKFLFLDEPKEKPLSTKRKNTYLLIIGGLLKELKIDYEKKAYQKL